MTTKVSLIADDSVKTGTIFNGTVNSEDLNSTAGSQAVTTDTIRDGAVTFSKLQNDASVDANRAVGTNHIQDKAVTAAKLADDTLPYLSFPLGGIVMWSGTIAQIPLGWYLCDGGTYGGIKTPDLRNKFIVGATVGGDTVYPGVSIGAEGGIADATLVSHGHTGVSTVSPSTVLSSLAGGPTRLQGATGGTPLDYNTTISVATSISIEGEDETNKNLPPYYALAYIMKCEFRAGSTATITTTVPTLQELRLNGPLYDQEMDGGAQKGNPGDVLTSLGDGNGVRWSSAGGVPVGSVFHFAAATPPTGYLKANGDTVPNGVGTVQGVTANFAPLYAVLGSTYGGAGKLPDLRGEFIRGWDDAKGVDTGRTFGSPQADQMQTITGKLYATYAVVRDSIIGAFTGSIVDDATAPVSTSPVYDTVENYSLLNFDSSKSPNARTGTETRSRNVALLACIKY